MVGPKKYFQEVVREGKRVRWPNRDIFVPTLIAVLIIAFLGALFLSLDDLAGSTLINQIKEAFQGWLGGGGGSTPAA